MKYYTRDEVLDLMVTVGLAQHAVGFGDGVDGFSETLVGVADDLDKAVADLGEEPSPFAAALRALALVTPQRMCSCSNCRKPPDSETLAAWREMMAALLDKRAPGQDAAGGA